MLCLLSVAKMAAGVFLMLAVTIVVAVTTILLLLEKKPVESVNASNQSINASNQSVSASNQSQLVNGDSGVAAVRLEPDLGTGEDLVWYRTADDLGRVVASLSTFLRNYDDQGGSGAKMKDCAPITPPALDETCYFRTTALGTTCQRENLWGYQKGQPCILISFDKVLAAGWMPEVYTSLDELPDDMPWDMRQFIVNATKDNLGKIPEMVWVSCNTENPEDEEYLGPVEYLPWRGFPRYYFPVRNTPEYVVPIVAVQFMKPASRRHMKVECRCWSKNMVYDREEGLGVVHLELILD